MMRMRLLKSRKILVAAILLTLGGTIIIEGLVMRAVVLSWRASSTPAGCACGSLQNGLDLDGGAMLGLAGLFLGGAALGLIALTMAGWRTRKLTRQIGPEVKDYAGVESAALFKGERCGAFTFGLWRPRIAICGHCAEICTPAELQAMVVHEAHHVARRDPLKFLALDILKYTYFFLPIFWSFAKMYRTVAELEADVQVTDRQALGQALLRVTDSRHTLGVAAFASVLGQRIERLVNPNWRLRLSFSPMLTMISAGFLTAAFWSAHHVPQTYPVAAIDCSPIAQSAPCQPAPGYGNISLNTLL